MSLSIYERIKSNVGENGELPEEFHLPGEENDKKVNFADGAMDGISLYHMGPRPMSEDDTKRLGELIMYIAKGDEKEAEDGFDAFCKEHRAIMIIDDVQRYIINHKDDISPVNLFGFSVKMLLESEKPECIKIGMSILELFKIYEDPNVVEAVRVIGLSDEFTIFSVFLMRKWPDGNREILDLAKKVHGWGRIHCVDFIEPENEEIKEWLLTSGVENEILPAYSGYRVYEKTDIENILQNSDLSYKHMRGVLQIATAMLDEGPISGISNLDDPEAFISKILECTKRPYPFTEEDKEMIKMLEEWHAEE